jgi:hypothetical protein
MRSLRLAILLPLYVPSFVTAAAAKDDWQSDLHIRPFLSCIGASPDTADRATGSLSKVIQWLRLSTTDSLPVVAFPPGWSPLQLGGDRDQRSCDASASAR